MALEICTGVISGAMPSVAELPERETLITTRWQHLELHETIPPLPVHAIATYYGPPAPRTWQVGATRLAGVGRPGGFAIVPAGWWGRWDISGASSLSYVLLSDARLQELADRSRRVELVPRVAMADPLGSHMLRALSRHAAAPDPSCGLFVEQALDLLCLHLLRTHADLAPKPGGGPRGGLLPWQVRRITTHMRERLDEDLGLDALAALVGLSRFHFCTAFRLATGQTPHACLTALRIERARALLADPQASVTEIALSVGYRTPSAFAASFRRAVGLTPSQFRRSL